MVKARRGAGRARGRVRGVGAQIARPGAGDDDLRCVLVGVERAERADERRRHGPVSCRLGPPCRIRWGAQRVERDQVLARGSFEDLLARESVDVGDRGAGEELEVVDGGGEAGLELTGCRVPAGDEVLACRLVLRKDEVERAQDARGRDEEPDSLGLGAEDRVPDRRQHGPVDLGGTEARFRRERVVQTAALSVTRARVAVDDVGGPVVRERADVGTSVVALERSRPGRSRGCL